MIVLFHFETGAGAKFVLPLDVNEFLPLDKNRPGSDRDGARHRGQDLPIPNLRVTAPGPSAHPGYHRADPGASFAPLARRGTVPAMKTEYTDGTAILFHRIVWT